MQENNQNQGTLVNVKRVRRDTDKSGRDKLVLTFGLDKDGNNGLDTLIDALESYRGKQVNFDIRVQEKTGSTGTFETAFVIVKEMVPKSEGTTKFVPKGTASKGATAKANSEKIRKQFEG